jgi:hypothetical protein
MDSSSRPNTRVLERFAEHGDQVARRLAADSEFRSLCQEYEVCAQALAHWSQAAQESPDRVTEYTQLLEELEQEIREILETESQPPV